MSELHRPQILVGGVGRSGTTLLKDLLNKHELIYSFGETKLVNKMLYPKIATYVNKHKPGERQSLIAFYKALILGPYYKYQVVWELPVIINKFKNLVQNKVQNQLEIGGDLSGKAAALLRKVYVHPAVNAPKMYWKSYATSSEEVADGFRGLRYFDKDGVFASYLGIFDQWNEAKTLEEIECIHGAYWHSAFSQLAELRGKKIWAEKSPDNAQFLNLHHRMFSNPKLITIFRDGRDVSASNMKMDWGASSISASMRHWANQVGHILDQQKQLPKSCYLNLRYEDLVGNTEGTLKKICSFLSIAYDPNMLDGTVRSTSLQKHKLSLSDTESQEFFREYQSIFEQLGYHQK